jgi:hypothetical protein
LKVPGGQPTQALESLCRRVASGGAADPPARATLRREAKTNPALPAQQTLQFPRQEPGQRARFWVEVAAWAFRSAWLLFMRLPRWVRLVAYAWVTIAAVSFCNSWQHQDSADISPAKVEKLKSISQSYQGGLNKEDVLKLGARIAKEFSDESDEVPAGHGPLLAIPFTAPAGDQAAEKLADSAFAMTYGMVSISHHGQVNLSKDPLPSRELGAALERGRANHSIYVLVGTVDTVDGAQALAVKIAAVADGTVVWSKSYPAAGADPAKIAAEVDAKIPNLAANDQ